MKALRRGLLGVLALLFAYVAAGTLGGMIPADMPADRGPIAHQVLLLPGPIHTDIAIPAADILPRFGWLHDYGVPVEAAGWVVFGWGARDFYTTTGTYADLSVGPVLRAIFGDASVMRVDVIAESWTPDNVTVLDLTQAQMNRLLDAIAASFAAPTRALDDPGFTATDRFFAGTGRFHAGRTCNVWVGEVLRAASVPVGVWTPFTWSLP